MGVRPNSLPMMSTVCSNRPVRFRSSTSDAIAGSLEDRTRFFQTNAEHVFKLA